MCFPKDNKIIKFQSLDDILCPSVSEKLPLSGHTYTYHKHLMGEATSSRSSLSGDHTQDGWGESRLTEENQRHIFYACGDGWCPVKQSWSLPVDEKGTRRLPKLNEADGKWAGVGSTLVYQGEEGAVGGSSPLRKGHLSQALTRQLKERHNRRETRLTGGSQWRRTKSSSSKENGTSW